ncbi:DUF2147 domain-containing protein [Gelidibacter sp. DF109]|uniref:DUF2147 domain-containing protein n=1 Tax=Gelidibacter pelagius TaxID=2819985 RepID=A0ABS3SMW3_9FLAO|nr:DUF2147 domain-containing protein [Gelidibacter pelagius]
MKRYLLSLGLLLFSISVTQAQNIVGQWKTVDDETGQTKSIVELYKDNGKLYGKIVKLLLPEDKGKLCTKCTGKDYNQPIEGLIIAKGLTKDKDDNTYEGGTIFDPEKGKEYKCKMWIDPAEPNMLNVRGYVAFFYRTQKWYRVTD